MSTRATDLLQGILLLALVAAAALFCIDAFNWGLEWASPGWVVLLAGIAVIAGIMLLADKAWPGWLALAFVFFLIADALNWGIGNWFVLGESSKDSSTKAPTTVTCTLTPEAAGLIGDYNDLYDPDITLAGDVSVTTADQADCDTVKSRFTTLLSKLKPAGDTPTPTQEAEDEPTATPKADPTATPTSAADAFTFDNGDAETECSIDSIVHYNDGDDAGHIKLHELGGNGLQLWRYSANTKTPAVWILLPVMEPLEVSGYAEAWEGNPPENCADFDWRGLAAKNQRPGDSTVFIDARSNPVKVDAGDMNPDDAQRIADKFMKALEKAK